MRLEDKEFIVKDVILKDGLLYVVLEGTLTGSFALELKYIKYIRYLLVPDRNKYRSEMPPIGDYARFDEFLISNDTNHYSKDVKTLVVGTGRTNWYWMVREQDMALIMKRSQVTKEQNAKNEKMQAQKDKQRRQIQENVFKKEMIAKYGTEFGSLIGKHQVTINMTKEMCQESWGEPINIYRTITKFGESEVWCYNYKTRIYFFEGKVVQIDN